ncbi:MAG TPA: hypothetical protein VE270_02680 [Thermoleophilaceae bacterium]|nr:hypothetical protein [Thermoleophilaceae bacterium]
MWLRGHSSTAALLGALLALAFAACNGDSSSGVEDSSGTGSGERAEQPAADEERQAGEVPAGGPPVYVGAQPGIPVEAIPFGDRPARPAILETSGDAVATRLRWQGWGAPETVARGVARVNSCEPSCARGRLVRRPGVVATLGDLRDGACRGRAARFYAHATVDWPPGLGLPPRQEFKLLPRCAEVD